MATTGVGARPVERAELDPEGRLPDKGAQVRKLLRAWGVLRIGYGLLALLAPDVLLRMVRLRPHPDVRGFNAFLGSRDIVLGAYSLAAGRTRRERDAVILNHANEVIDSIVLVQEIRAGRKRDLFTVAGFAFNGLGWLTWLRAWMLLR